MGPKSRNATPSKAGSSTTPAGTPSSASRSNLGTPSSAHRSPGTPSSGAGGASSKNLGLGTVDDLRDIAQKVWGTYWSRTPQRTKLLDAFMGFLVVVGAVQFVYVVVAGNYPFNAFLAGFSAAVGQFVLAASLRIQTNPENDKEFQSISHERAFADFVFGSLLLHFFCVNFIN